MASQKLKILYLMEILLERTDEEHIMSAKDLGIALKEYDISAERKSIYKDIEALTDFGLDIIKVQGNPSGYYVASRDFELAELKLLVDAVQASKFITAKKSNELIKKLEQLASRYDAKQLQRQVYIYNRPKAYNETIYYNVDRIHSSIFKNVQIKFHYTEWTMEKKLVEKKDGNLYCVSPWALTWDDENYYLIAYDEEADAIKHYRVDKMKDIQLCKERRLGKEKFKDFDLPAFSKKTFGMYGGREEAVSLRCHNSVVGVVIDRFGQDVMIVPEDKEHFKVRVDVAISPQFFGWLTAIGTRMKIVTPKKVREEYRDYLKDVLGETE